MLKRTLLAASLASLSCFAGTALAYEAGDVILRGGLVTVNPSTSGDTATTKLIDVGTDTQMGLTLSWMLTPHVGVEVLGASPFTHEIKLGGAKIGQTQHLPPTVSLQWYPLGGGDNVQPYVGAGLNHTFFFQTTSTLGSLDLDSSTSWSAHVGVDIPLNEKLVFNAVIYRKDINTDVFLNGAKLGELELDPWGVMAGVGYRF